MSGSGARYRGGRYPCPADCPYNPWAPEAYDQEMAIEALINRVRELHVLMENAATRADDPEKMLDTLKPLRHALLYVALTLAWFSDDKSVPPSKDLSLSHAALLLGLLVLRAVIDELDRASSEL